jgi:hypothetical protein
MYNTAKIVTQPYYNVTVIRTLSVLIWVFLCKMNQWSTLTTNFHTQCTNPHSFDKIYFHQTDSTPQIFYSTQTSKIKIKIFYFRCILVRSAKAYVNQFFALPKAMYSHSRYLLSIRKEGNIVECSEGRKAGGRIGDCGAGKYVICHILGKHK